MLIAAAGSAAAVFVVPKLRKAPADPDRAEATSEKTSAAAASLPEDAPLPSPPFTPPEEVRWPQVAPERAAWLGEAKRELALAGASYALDTSQGRAEGDAHMLAALERCQRAGALPQELRAYHQETLIAPESCKDYAEVERRALLWLRGFPDDLLARQVIYTARFQLHNWRGAIEAAEPLLARRPRDVQALSIAAVSYFELGQWSKAADLASRALLYRPQDIDLRRLVAESCFELGDKERGVRAVRDGLALLGYPQAASWQKPAAPKFFKSAIKVLHRFQEYRDLAPLAAFYRRHEPQDIEAVLAEGVSRLHNGEFALSEPLLHQALASPANRDEVRFSLGLAQSKQGKLEAAARTFAGLLAQRPAFVRAYHQLGLVLSRLGRAQDAESIFSEARRLAPAEREERRAEEFDGIGNGDAAAATRALALVLLSDFGGAERVLVERGAKGGGPTVWMALAGHYLDVLRVADALVALERVASRLGREHEDVVGERARAHWLLGEREEALRLLRPLASRAGTSPTRRYQLARCLLENGAAAEVRALLAPLRTSAGEREASLLLGRAEIALGEPERAEELLRSISRGDTRWDEWEAGTWLALALVGPPRPHDAARALEAWKLLDEVPPLGRGSLVELEARWKVTAALEATGATTAPPNAGGASTARERWERAAKAEPELRELLRRAARSTWPDAGETHAAIAELYQGSGNALLARRHGRLALEARPQDARLLRRLVDWHSGAGDVFQRLHFLQRLRALEAGDHEVSAQATQLEERWYLGAEGRN
jgi:tetratricopeptide (TPR) repeat protein